MAALICPAHTELSAEGTGCRQLGTSRDAAGRIGEPLPAQRLLKRGGSTGTFHAPLSLK